MKEIMCFGSMGNSAPSGIYKEKLQSEVHLKSIYSPKTGGLLIDSSYF